jgi:hypothetical protein
MALFQLDDVFTYQDANDIKRLWAATDLPTSGIEKDEILLHVDNSAGTLVLKRYNADGSWSTVGEVTQDNLLNLIQSIDGSGSGMDADKLDGQEGSYYQNAANLNSGTIPSSRLSASDLLTKIMTVDGSASGLDADKVDGTHASQFIRSDTDDNVTGHTEWQDNYQVRLGNGADLRLYHNGNDSVIYNYTGNLYLMNLAAGQNVFMGAHDNSNNWRTLLIMDPDTNLVTGRISRTALVDFWRDSTTNETANPHIQTGQLNGTGDSENWYKSVTFDQPFTSTPRMVANSTISTATSLISDVTTTGWTLYSRYANIYYDWWAIGKKS